MREEVRRNIAKKVGRFGRSGGLSEGGSFAKSCEKSGDGRWGWSMLDRSSPYSTQNEGSSAGWWHEDRNIARGLQDSQRVAKIIEMRVVRGSSGGEEE